MTDTRFEHERRVALLRPSNMRELGGLRKLADPRTLKELARHDGAGGR